MPKPESIAQAEERLRAAIGAAFFLLSVYYVASTIARMTKSAS
jgi:hypothetical protein